MVSPVWRIRAICIIFMNTLSAWTSILFNLGVPRLKELLCEKKNFTAGEEEHMQRGDAPGQTMMQNNLKEQKGIEQDWASKRRYCASGFLLHTWTPMQRHIQIQHKCGINSEMKAMKTEGAWDCKKQNSQIIYKPQISALTGNQGLAWETISPKLHKHLSDFGTGVKKPHL